ncbi:MAG: transferase hexapeptide repeat family protein [Chitinophagales bacterium]|jgi:carbonic anhydrase/acetyltransferase-like protein (isoleucine patch superfamily)|nr:transferase hexapeptide repeat family protein [Chitinophagales bacterium]
MYYQANGIRPVVDASSYVHPQAIVIGQVVIGKNCYIGPGAVLRGDWGAIEIEEGCNVQENCVIHMFPGLTVRLLAGAHIGHGAVIHGAVVGRNCLVGINSVVMDHVVLGDESIVGALTLIREGEQIAPRSLVVGNPGKVIRQVNDEMLGWKTEGTTLYQQLPQQCFDELKKCTPLRKPRVQTPLRKPKYLTWKNKQKK